VGGWVGSRKVPSNVTDVKKAIGTTKSGLVTVYQV
jgi:hypothetical protein